MASRLDQRDTGAAEGRMEELEGLEVLSDDGPSSPPLDAAGSLAAGLKGTGPRLFCGHVPKETTEEMVFQHFSQWGNVTDVYFPRHKKTMKRRPFCFVTFSARDGAERALAESPLNICGIPIKNLTLVEDRDKYYKEKHATARDALLKALQSLGNGGSSQVTPDQISNLAAIMALEGVGTDGVLQSLGLPSPPRAAAGVLPPASAAAAPPTNGALLAANAAALHAAVQQAAGGLSMSPFGLAQTGAFGYEAALAAVASAGVSSLTLSGASSSSMGYGASDSLLHMGSDSRSVDWFSPSSSARTSIDASSFSAFMYPGSQLGALGPCPMRMSEPASAPLSGAASISPASSLSTLRRSLDVLHMHQAQQAQQQQQQQALLAMAHAGQQAVAPASLQAALQNALYQPASAAAYCSPPQPQQLPAGSAVHHSINTVMQSGLFQSSAPPAPAHAAPVCGTRLSSGSGFDSRLSGGFDTRLSGGGGFDNRLSSGGGFDTRMSGGYECGGGLLPAISEGMWSQLLPLSNPGLPPRPPTGGQRTSFAGPPQAGSFGSEGAPGMGGAPHSSDVLAVMAGWGVSSLPLEGPPSSGFQWPTSSA